MEDVSRHGRALEAPRRGWLSSSKNLNLVNDSLPIPVQTPGFLGWEAAEAF